MRGDQGDPGYHGMIGPPGLPGPPVSNFVLVLLVISLQLFFKCCDSLICCLGNSVFFVIVGRTWHLRRR